jgi:hypothetical protein
MSEDSVSEDIMMSLDDWQKLLDKLRGIQSELRYCQLEAWQDRTQYYTNEVKKSIIKGDIKLNADFNNRMKIFIKEAEPKIEEAKWLKLTNSCIKESFYTRNFW